MNKELEALNEMINKFVEILLEAKCEKPTAVTISSLNNTLRLAFHDKLDIVEKALKELQECREMMRRFNEACAPMILDNETEKKLKALDIVKKYPFEVASVIAQPTYKDYCCWFATLKDAKPKLSQEEYDLLREVLL